MYHGNKCLYALVCILIMACLSSVGLASVPGLVGWWSFDEGTGDVVADGSGNGNDGTLVNTTWEAGQLGSALGFNGTAYVDVPPQAWETISSQFTLAFWVYIPAANISQSNFVVNAFSDPANNDARVFSTHLPWAGNTVYFDTSGPGYDRTSKAITPAELTDAWNHWAFTKNADTGDVAIYRNGVLWHSATGLTKPLQGADITKFTIGTKSSLAEGWFTGMIDDVQLYNVSLSPEEIQAAMNGITRKLATNPVPATEATDVLRNVTLEWAPGEFAGSHNVYVGTSAEEVDSATAATASGLTVTSLDLGRLDLGQTYYWRVDEVNATPDKTVFKGETWNFSVEPYSIMIPVDVDNATASSSIPGKTPGLTVNGSGLVGNTHSTKDTDMWLSAAGDLSPWLMYEFSQVQKLDKMLIWNANTLSEGFIGWGLKDVTIETSVDGESWTAMAESTHIDRAPGLATYDAPQAIDLGLTLAKYVRITILSNWGGLLKQYSVSEIQIYGLPVFARTPNPASGSVAVVPDTVATWRAGREAVSHTIYMDTDPNAVADGSAASVSSSTNSLAIGSLDPELGQTYYWRVDEVNDAEAPSVWAGPVWSLSTVPALVVDDFESYGNKSPNRPFQTWHDGYGYSADDYFPADYSGNGTGAGVGHDIWAPSSPYFNGQIMETALTIAGSGQSLPFYYNNSTSTSQIDRQFAAPQDWTAFGVKTLGLSFFGAADNTGQIYVKINGTKKLFDLNANAIQMPEWQFWGIDLASLGINLTSVTSLSIGIEGAGSGLVLIDDIKLYNKAVEYIEPVQPGTDSLVAKYTFDGNFSDSSGHGNTLTKVGSVVVVNDPIRGQVAALNGTTDALSVPVIGTGTTDAVTISVWVKLDLPNDTGALWSVFHSNGWAAGDIHCHINGTSHFSVGVNGVDGGDLAAPTVAAEGLWYHVAYVLTQDTVSLYVNGVLADSAAGAGDPAFMFNLGDGTLGAWFNTTTPERLLQGQLDDVRFYTTGLSAEEVAGLAGRSKMYKPL